MSKKLIVTDGTRERELLLVGRIVVGRDPLCDITYDDGLLSRRHAEFVAAGDQVIVRDLGSRNGVFVNGAKIAEHALRSGDVVQIGPVRARYVADRTPISIAPEQIDADHTAVINLRPSQEPPSRPPGTDVPRDLRPSWEPPSPRPGTEVEDEDDRTRRIPGPPPQAVAAPVAAAAPPSSAQLDFEDDDRTQFLPRPQPMAVVTSVPAADLRPRREPLSPVPAQMPVATASRIAPPTSLTAFVFVQLLGLAGVVLLASVVPLIVWRRGALTGVDQTGPSVPLVWLAVPVAVALVASYCFSVLINRRFVDALVAVERDKK